MKESAQCSVTDYRNDIIAEGNLDRHAKLEFTTQPTGVYIRFVVEARSEAQPNIEMKKISVEPIVPNVE